MRQRNATVPSALTLVLLVGLWIVPGQCQEELTADRQSESRDSLDVVQADSTADQASGPVDSLGVPATGYADSSTGLRAVQSKPPAGDYSPLEYHPAAAACDQCGTVNDWNYPRCLNCGESLNPVKNQWVRLSTALSRAEPEPGMSGTFHLRNGEIVRGSITAVENRCVAVIRTQNGLLRIPTAEILADIVDVVKKDGMHISGSVSFEDDHSISVKTSYGLLSLLKREIKTIDHYFWDRKLIREVAVIRREELPEIYRDPTALPLQPEVIYLSGFLLEYGFNRNFTLKTHLGNDFFGDLNLQPLYRFLHKDLMNFKISAALAAELYNNHPAQQEAETYSHWIIDSTADARLDESGAPAVSRALHDPEKRGFFWRASLLVSGRRGFTDRRGNWGWHFGLCSNALALETPSLKDGYIWDDAFSLPYRAWVAVDYDLTEKFKLIIKASLDNGHKISNFTDGLKTYYDFSGTPFRFESQSGDFKPVDMDLGLLWTMSDALRVEFHTQFPFITLSWKF